MESEMRQVMIHKLHTTRSGKYSDFIDRINSELPELLFLQHIPTEKPNKSFMNSSYSLIRLSVSATVAGAISD